MKKSAAKKQPVDIYTTLRTMINNLIIHPGSRVTETQLADYFKVSRTPVRAALQKLENEGLLVIKPKQGCFIRNIDMKMISQYYDVRATLENMVLAELHKNIVRDKLERLSQDWDPTEYRFGVELTEKLKKAEEGFHAQLAEMAGNPALVRYITDINLKIRCVRLLGWPDEESVMDTYAEHHRICELLLAGDLATAQAEMAAHIATSKALANQLTYHQVYNSTDTVSFE